MRENSFIGQDFADKIKGVYIGPTLLEKAKSLAKILLVSIPLAGGFGSLFAYYGASKADVSYPQTPTREKLSPISIREAVKESNLEKETKKTLPDFNAIRVNPKYEQEVNEAINYAFGKIPTPHYISHEFIRRNIGAESNGNPYAKPKKSKNLTHAARGANQLKPWAWKDAQKKLRRLGVELPNYWTHCYDLESNTLAGLAYFIVIDDFLKENFQAYSDLPDTEKQKYLWATYYEGMAAIKRKEFDISRLSNNAKEHLKKFGYDLHTLPLK